MEDVINNLGHMIKSARRTVGMTQNDLSCRLDVSVRYIMALENEGRQPSFEVLVKLIHTLALSPEQIFYPADVKTENEKEQLIRLLALCDERDLSVVAATIRALIESK